MDDIASSTTPSTTVGNIPIHKIQKNVIANESPITIRVAETASDSPSLSLNTNNRIELSNNNNCQNYQHLVGILSTPPIAHNSLIVAAAVDAVGGPQEPHERIQNQQKPLSPSNSEHAPSLPWIRHRHDYEGSHVLINYYETARYKALKYSRLHMIILFVFLIFSQFRSR